MRSPFIVKSMHRMLKDNELKRAKARARMAARADTKAKARVSNWRREKSDVPTSLRNLAVSWLADVWGASVTVLKLPTGNSEELQCLEN